MANKTGYIARARFVMVAPSKIRRVADVVRRMPYNEAVAVLDNLPQKGAELIKKVIVSAASNALYKNKNIDEGMLYVKELFVDDGPRMKRMWYRARGRADMLLKRMSHITAVVDEIKKAGA